MFTEGVVVLVVRLGTIRRTIVTRTNKFMRGLVLAHVFPARMAVMPAALERPTTARIPEIPRNCHTNANPRVRKATRRTWRDPDRP